MGKTEFPLGAGVLEELCAEIEKQGYYKKHNGKYIYVNLCMVRMQMAWVLPKLFYARGAADALDAGVIVLCWNESPELEKLTGAFGMELYVINRECRKNIRSFLRAGIKTSLFLLADGSGEGLKKMKKGDVPVGASMYEDILRTSDLSTIRSCRNSTCIKKIVHLLWMYGLLEIFVKNHKPLLLVSDDIAYHEWMQEALFYTHGAKIKNVSPAADETIRFDENLWTVRRGERNNEAIHREMERTGDEILTKAEEYIEKRFAGKSGREIDRQAYAGKRVIDRAAAAAELGLDPEKKNVIILAHTFTDAIFNYGHIYFRDYYEWCEETLKAAAKVKNVNWILKPHPTRKSYHEDKDSIEDMFARHKTDNMFFFGDDISAASLKDVADVLVTIGGNGGAEFACAGVPAVIAGVPYYKGFGYTVEPKDREEYLKVLENIAEIRHLDEEQIKTAKKVFYLKASGVGEYRKFDDVFARMVRDGYRKMREEIALEYFESDKGTKKYNDRITKEMIEYLRDADIRKTEYYKRGMKCTV
ncbi:MAG: hypothetical protein K5686_02885 [Lachnospiraceae bacterium]|nr:hypothetical protein [Lachnospiraceae bacterium]